MTMHTISVKLVHQRQLMTIALLGFALWLAKSVLLTLGLAVEKTDQTPGFLGHGQLSEATTLLFIADLFPFVQRGAQHF
jgi:hypothetical protein